MINENEKLFIEYWEKNRLKQNSLVYQLLTGLPVGLLFALPIFLILFSGRWWHKRADMVANSQMNPWVLTLAVFIIAVFVAILFKKHRWDMREQQYLELKAKAK